MAQNQVEKIERSKDQEQVRQTIMIAGDSMVRNMKGWLMSRRKSVKVQTFPGANTDEMEIFIKPLINKNPQACYDMEHHKSFIYCTSL